LTTVLSYGALVVLGYLVFRIVEPFAAPLAWSAIFAIFFYPVYERLEKRFTPTTGALLCAGGVTLLLILPVLFVLLYAAREAIDASARIRSFLSEGGMLPTVFADWLRQHLPKSMEDIDFVGPLRQRAERIAAYLASSLGLMVKNLFSLFVNLFISLFALFFMFRDGKKIMRAVRHLIPFERQLQDGMLSESRDLIFASVAVALLIATIQGILGGTAFALAGVKAPVFLGLLVAFFSIVPVVGSALIWVPAALWLGVNGHWGKAIIVVGMCGGVAGLADNLVRPMLLRNRTRLNDLLVFLSILGGLQVFGLLGLVIGPTVVAAALGVFRVYMESREHLETKQA
jgi:predicted PurR-regulated permease PerM